MSEIDIVQATIIQWNDAVLSLKEMNAEVIKDPNRDLLDEYLLQITTLNEVYWYMDHVYRVKHYVTEKTMLECMEEIRKSCEADWVKFVKNKAEIEVQTECRSEIDWYKSAEHESKKFKISLDSAKDVYRHARDKMMRGTALDKDINSLAPVSTARW